MQPLAAAVSATRKPAADDNPFLVLQTQVSEQITTALDAYRVARDKLDEQMFFGFYGSPFVQAFLGINDGQHCAAVPENLARKAGGTTSPDGRATRRSWRPAGSTKR